VVYNVSNTNYTDLIKAASAARQMAYAPYSGFQVGAALATRTGKIFTGCNIENVSLGLTICAERSAIATAIAEGNKDFVAIAVVTSGKKPAIPCGACRQVLAEFVPNIRVVSATVGGEVQEFGLAALLPFPSQGILEGPPDV
jgi:cytidine deaminase